MQHEQLQLLRDFLHDLLQRQAPADGLKWLTQKQEEIAKTQSVKSFYLSFSGVTRYLGKARLALDDTMLHRAQELRQGFRPTHWTVGQIGRVWLLLHLPNEQEDEFVERLEMLFSTADMGELVALYSSLPLLPYPQRYQERCAEGVRTNMTNVFDAIALDNPYPSEFLTQGAWNQLVLKAAFMDRPIYRIYGIEKRANAELAQIISDYAHERWAANRSVSPEFWRPVSSFLNEVLLEDLTRLLASGDDLQQKAAALVCAHSDHQQAHELLEQYPAVKSSVQEQAIDWTQIGKAWWARKEKATV